MKGGGHVTDFTTTTTQVGHSITDTWKYPFVGDMEIIHIQRVIVDADDGRVIRLKMPADLHRSSLCDDVVCGDGPQDMQWAKDGRTLAFVSTSRDHKVGTVRIAEATTGAVRDVFSETVPTWFDSGFNDEGINCAICRSATTGAITICIAPAPAGSCGR